MSAENPPVRVARIDPDQGMGGNLGRGDFAPRRQRMRFGDDAKELSLRQGLERDRRMLQTRTHRRHLAAPEQKKVDRVLDLEDVEIDQKIGIAAAQVRHRQRRHCVADARRRAEPELRAVAPLQRPDREVEVVEVAVKLVDLGEDRRRLGRRNETPSAPREEPRAERILGVFHQSAETRRGDVQEPRRPGDASGQHDGADDFDLAQGQHGQNITSCYGQRHYWYLTVLGQGESLSTRGRSRWLSASAGRGLESGRVVDEKF